MEKSGAQILIECLEREKVEIVFGYPGGMILPVYDALRESRIKHVLTRHEQAAAHAADGYARATGRVGVCMATSGPGAMNLATGVATAFMDSIPVVAITGQVHVASIGTDSFQEVDITGATLPITKHNYLVKKVEDLPRVVKEAFHIASTGRPGPVLIDLPVDVANSRLSRYHYPEKVNLPGYKPTYQGHPLQIARAAKAIAQARQPVLCAGGGVISSGAAGELLQLVELTRIPVTTTLMGLGAIPGDHPLFLGMLGLHGTACANYAVTECDLLIAVGARFGNRVTGAINKFAPRARIIHIDIDPAEIGKNVAVEIPIVGDVKMVLRALLKHLSPGTETEWHQRIRQWKEDFPLSYREVEGTLKPQYVIQQVSELTSGKAIVVTDVGQHQMWTAQYYRFVEPRSLITSGGLGTMGYGFPAAVGAQMGFPGRPVVLITGEGSFQMNMQEMSTAMAHGLALKVVILNNGLLGMVRQLQEIFWGRRYSQVELQAMPDFVKLAEAYGAAGVRVTRKEDVRPALEEALGNGKLTLMDFVVDPAENVYPMVPGGKGLNEMLMGVD